jgi:hypothetical protein
MQRILTLIKKGMISLATVQSCVYDETSSTYTLPTYFDIDTEHQMIMDFLVGTASYFNIESRLPFAIADLEDGGPGGNWMQLGSDAITSFQTFWSGNNEHRATDSYFC